jgi:hypothetical protein
MYVCGGGGEGVENFRGSKKSQKRKKNKQQTSTK